MPLKYGVKPLVTFASNLNYRILFLGYWNLDDGLTQSTILPHLQILCRMKNVEYIHFVNTQRELPSEAGLKNIHKLDIDYTPLYSKNIIFNYLNKIYDFIHFPKLIRRLCGKHQINLIISRGAPAGSLAYLATKKINIPFIVESFEPHAAYMHAAGEWRFYDFRYIFQKHWEKKQKKDATALITVAENYRNSLIEEGVIHNKIFNVPCAVDQKIFYKDDNLKKEIRSKLKIPPNAKLGVYAGKFGGLYLKDEAFLIFKKTFEQLNDFHLLLLTNTDLKWLSKMIEQYNLPSNRIHIDFVSHPKVNSYLNAADFAFALYKTNIVSRYLSPVKIGEYWAAGLPVFITPNLGDEMHWIREKGLGDIIDDDGSCFSKGIFKYSKLKIIREGTSQRGMTKVKEAYNQILT